MSEEMKKDVMETAEAVETAAPAETMDDYAAELEESYKTLEGKQPVYEAEEDPAAEKWQNFAQMMEDKTVFDVKVKEAVKGGLVAFVDDVANHRRAWDLRRNFPGWRQTPPGEPPRRRWGRSRYFPRGRAAFR